MDYIPEGLESRVLSTENKTRVNPITKIEEEYIAFTLKADYVITISDITEELAIDKVINDSINIGRIARACCADIYDYISAVIDSRTSAQIDTFITTYSDLMQLIQLGRPVSAKELLASTTATESLTQGMIDGVNKIFSRYGI